MFFFSSRRRHTRYWRDWSSDVCSSDLALVVSPGAVSRPVGETTITRAVNTLSAMTGGVRLDKRNEYTNSQIGRASCRERVEISVVAVSLKKTKDRDTYLT